MKARAGTMRIRQVVQHHTHARAFTHELHADVGRTPLRCERLTDEQATLLAARLFDRATSHVAMAVIDL
eukprot:313966-Prymnesium_polylepis.1